MKSVFSLFTFLVFFCTLIAQNLDNKMVLELRDENGQSIIKPEEFDSLFNAGHINLIGTKSKEYIQENQEPTLELGHAYYFLARFQIAQYQLSQALSNLDLAVLNYKLSNEECNSWCFMAMASKARTKSLMDSKDHISDLINTLSNDAKCPIDSLKHYELLLDLAYLEVQRNNFEIANSLLTKSQRFMMRSNKVNQSKQLINEGHYYFYKGLYDLAIEKYTSACNTLKLEDNKYYFIKGIGYLSSAYNYNGSHAVALQYESKKYRLIQEEAPELVIELAKSISQCGNIYRKMNKHDESVKKYFKALEILEPRKGIQFDHEKGVVLINLSIVYSEMNLLENAENCAIKSINLFEKHNSSIYIYKNAYLKSIGNLGTIEFYKSNYNEAAEIYDEVCNKIISTFNDRHESLIEPLSNLAIALENAGKIEESLSVYPRLYTLYGFDPNGDNPFVKLVFQEYLNISLWNHAEALKVLFYNTGNREYLRKSLFHFNHLLDLLDLMRTSYINNDKKLTLFNENKITYDRNIELSFQIWEKENDVSAKVNAFTVSERIKGLLLLEMFAAEKTKSSVQFDSLFFFHNEIQVLQTELFNNPSSILEEKLLDRYLNLVEKQSSLQQLGDRKLNLIFDFDVTTVRELQDNLGEDQSLLEYFVGDSSIYVFVVKPDTFQIKEVKKDFALEEWVSDVQKSILLQGSTSTQTDSLNQIFIERSNQLYNKIVSPVADLLTENLIIVPEGVLGYLPFDLLATNNATDIKDAQYLIEDHQIAYQYSATLWLEMKKKQVSPTKDVLAYAPDFPLRPVDLSGLIAMNRDSLYKLNYSKDEVNAIGEIWNSDNAFDDGATVQNFIRDASDYRIVHLSTHGKADDRVGDYCYLAFTKTSDTLDRKLYVRDLYNMKLNADMVVLSACETGLGELQQGEGILSLARGFAYAGAKSIVSTLWSVDDKSTSDIMGSFYKHLKDGKTKDASLRQAKLDYLSENKNAHPFYWAAFTAVGDMSPIESGWPWSYYLLGGLLLLGIAVFVYRALQNI